MNKKTFILIVVIVVAAIIIVWWYTQTPTTQAPTEGPSGVIAPPADTTSEISKELESVDVGDVDKEFQQIDGELNTL
jgi:hypothetical protein